MRAHQPIALMGTGKALCPSYDGIFLSRNRLTALLLADQVNWGAVALDTPVDQLRVGADSISPIALQALASHTAGLPRLPLARLLRASLYPANPYRGSQPEELYRAITAAEPEPGTCQYSNLGPSLLGQLLATAAGWQLDAYAPAGGLKSTLTDMGRVLQAAIAADWPPLALSLQPHSEACAPNFGLGWVFTELENAPMIMHNGLRAPGQHCWPNRFSLCN